MHDAAPWILQLAMGFALAATAGLRAFLPLFVVGLLARGGSMELAPAFDWMASTPALVVFGSAVAFEILGDKIPLFDHALHAGGVFVAPVAGTLAAASLLPASDPMVATALGLVSGGSVALAVHGARAALRPLATTFTLGAGNPVVSVAEDALAAGGVALALLFPILAALGVVGLVALAIVLGRRLHQRRLERAAPASTAG